MRVLELIRKRPVAAASLAGGILGTAIGLFLPIRAPQPPGPDKATWALPNANALKRFSNEQYQTVRNAPFWGDLAMPGQRGATAASSWTLVGIVTRPEIRIAITTSGKPQVSWVRIGAPLPDGGTFVAADRDTVWFEKDGCRTMRKLYQKASAQSGACAGAPAAAPTAAPTAQTATAPAGKSQ
jgi:hypothetical protein